MSQFVIPLVLTLVGLAVSLWLLERQRRRTHPVIGGRDAAVRLPHDAPVELYSNSFSHCSRKVRLVLAELDIAYKHHRIELIETGWYQTISPEYLKVNPSGLVPTLVHDGHPVYESDDIVAYAQSVAGSSAPQLAPNDPGLRAEMARWMAFCAISSADPMAGMEKNAGACVPGLTLPIFVTAIRYIPFRRIFVGLLFHPDKRRPLFFAAAKILGPRRLFGLKPVRAILEPSARHMVRHLSYINATLLEHGGPWILGGRYSLADATVSCLLLRLEETGWLETFVAAHDLGAVEAYYARLKARPSWGAAITDAPSEIIERARRDLAKARSDPALRQLIYGV